MAGGKRKAAPSSGGGRTGKRAAAVPAAVTSPSSSKGAADADPGAAVPPEFVAAVSHELRRRLTGLDPPLFTRGHAAERESLTEMLTASMVRGESNSALVIGGRGSGKSTLVDAALAAAAAADGVAERGYRVVRLNGLAHANDGTALKELARQVQVDLPGEVDGDGEGEGDGDGDGAAASMRNVSTGEIVHTLLAALKQGSSDTSQCLVIVLDEFDLFAHSGKQSLLYTLLDTAQAGLTPLAVVGLTCRYDAEDLLEKRVLSRFSRRKLYLSKALPFDEYTQVFRESVLAGPAARGRWPAAADRWDAEISTFAQSGAVVRELRQLYDTNGRDFRALQQLAATAVLRLCPASPFPSASRLYAAMVRQRADSKTKMILSLSLLEVSLVIAMSNLRLDSGGDPANFETTYNAYTDFIGRAASEGGERGRAYSKPVAFKAFEHLADLELVTPTTGAAGTPAPFRPMGLVIEPEQIADALKRYPALPTHVRMWLRIR